MSFYPVNIINELCFHSASAYIHGDTVATILFHGRIQYPGVKLVPMGHEKTEEELETNHARTNYESASISTFEKQQQH
ncbi:hypothetical protein PABG_12283 [Paracoccidioides brasiliensis Pb03]|nr:hypothetical protein PABG_12283 [Paracoccidioides brasiliensis Pb03]